MWIAWDKQSHSVTMASNTLQSYGPWSMVLSSLVYLYFCTCVRAVSGPWQSVSMLIFAATGHAYIQGICHPHQTHTWLSQWENGFRMVEIYKLRSHLTSGKRMRNNNFSAPSTEYGLVWTGLVRIGMWFCWNQLLVISIPSRPIPEKKYMRGLEVWLGWTPRA